MGSAWSGAMSKKRLKRILEDVGAGKDIIPLFLEAGCPPRDVYWSLKYFLENAETPLVRKVAGKRKVSPQYLIDRVSDIVEKIDGFLETNPYAILGLNYHADAAEIQEKWKTLLKEWHPDKQKGGEESLAMTQRINDAYATLRTPESRKAYDRQYAPFLMIAKDIGEHPAAPFPVSRRRFFPWSLWVVGALAVVAVAVLWSRRPTPSSPLRRGGTALEDGAKTMPASGLNLSVESAVKRLTPSSSVNPSEKAPRPITCPVETVSVKPKPVKVAFATPSREGIRTTAREPLLQAERLPRKSVSPTAAPRREIAALEKKAGQARKMRSRHPNIAVSAWGETGKRSGGGFTRCAFDFSGSASRIFLGRGEGPEDFSQPAFTSRHVAVALKVPLGGPEEVVRRYIDCYLRGDYKELLRLFDTEAVENGVPVRGSAKNYRTFFQCLRVTKFDFRKERAREEPNTCLMQGRYVMEYRKKSGDKTIKNAGRLSFLVVRDKKGGAWRIKEIAYH